MVPIECSVLAQTGKITMWVGLVQRVTTKLSNAASSSAGAEVNNKMAGVHVEELSRFKRLLWII